jgi:glucose-1-phosphate thymidylyltransferase
MIDWPIRTIKDAGITDIMVVTGAEHAGDVFSYCGSGERFGVNFNFAVQDKPNGIAGALALCETWAGEDEPVMVILGDNIFGQLDYERRVSKMGFGMFKCVILIKSVPNPERFGVVTISQYDHKVISIEEKPVKPASDAAVTGLYVFPPDVWGMIRSLEPSGRGELEVTDIIRRYIVPGRMDFVEMADTDYWSDAGTMESYRAANEWAWRQK